MWLLWEAYSPGYIGTARGVTTLIMMANAQRGLFVTHRWKTCTPIVEVRACIVEPYKPEEHYIWRGGWRRFRRPIMGRHSSIVRSNFGPLQGSRLWPLAAGTFAFLVVGAPARMYGLVCMYYRVAGGRVAPSFFS